jgi:hypothetical protein
MMLNKNHDLDQLKLSFTIAFYLLFIQINMFVIKEQENL